MFEKIKNLNLQNLDNNKVYIITAPQTITRKNIHLYLEKYYPKIGKTSLRCNLFPKSDKNYLIARCYECTNKDVVLNQYVYNYGNEYAKGECKKCYDIVIRELEYDSSYKNIDGNNIIVLGNYFEKYKNKESKENNENLNLDNLLAKSNIYQIETPVYKISKTNFEKYIKLEYILQFLYLYLNKSLIQYVIRKYLHFI